MPKTIETTLNNKPITFTAETFLDFRLEEDDVRIFMEAKLPEENKDTWRQTYFPDISNKDFGQMMPELDKLYDHLEKELIRYAKEQHSNLDVDWDAVIYHELLPMDNNFKMSAMINQ